MKALPACAWVFLAGLLSAPSVAGPPGQNAPQNAPQNAGQANDQEQQAEQAKIEKYLDLAQNGRVSVRPQAARRLLKMGPAAAQRVLAACGEAGGQMHSLGPYLVEVLGDFEQPKLRELLWKKLRDPDFPWRGPAARSLAHKLHSNEIEPFLELCADHLDQVRLAAVGAIEQYESLDAQAHTRAARQQLIQRVNTDPSDRVRRAAALQLDAWGEAGYLLWLVEDLKRTDKYFRLPLGEQARFASIRALRERLGDDFSFQAEKSPHTPENAKAIEQLSAAVLARAEGQAPVLPALVLAGEATPGDKLGLELRSCRVGQFFLRWNEKDVLYVGTGRARAIQLEKGSVAHLEQALAELVPKLGEARYWGTAGCDIEQLRVVNGQGQVQAFLVSKGQAAVPGLRPVALDQMLDLLVASLPHEQPAEGGDSLRAEVTRALLLLGGPFQG